MQIYSTIVLASYKVEEIVIHDFKHTHVYKKMLTIQALTFPEFGCCSRAKKIISENLPCRQNVKTKWGFELAEINCNINSLYII